MLYDKLKTRYQYKESRNRTGMQVLTALHGFLLLGYSLIIKYFSKDSYFNLDLNTVVDVASTVLVDKAFHTLIILNEKKCSRESSLGTAFFSFQLWPRVELDLSISKNLLMGVSILWCRILQHRHKSAHNRLNSKVHIPAFLRRAGQFSPSYPSNRFVNIR